MEEEIKKVFEEKKNRLLWAKNRIERMPNNKKRAELVDAYIHLLNYYFYGNPNADEECSEKFEIDSGWERYLKCIYHDTKKKIDDTEANAQVLYDKFKKIVDTYKDNDFCMYRYSGYEKTDSKKLDQAVYDFLATLGDDVLGIYYNMIYSGNILSTPDDLHGYSGFSFESNPIDNPSVVVMNIPKYLEYYMIIVHELGHCYQFYLQRNQRNYATFDIYSEITSILFELLFVEYLKTNHIINDDFKIELVNHATLLENSSVSKVLCDEFKKDDFKVIDPIYLSYTTKRPIEELQNEVNDDCANLSDDDTEIEFNRLHYSFGQVAAMHFLEKLKSNFEIEWENYKNYICTMNYLPMSEVIEECFDTELVEKNIKQFIKSYPER